MIPERLRPYKPLAWILLGTALLQAVLLWRLPTISADGIIFIRLAHQLADDPLYTMRIFDQHPGFPALLLGTSSLLKLCGFAAEPDVWMASGQLLSFIAGLFTVAIVWLLARELFDTTIANIAAIGYACLPVPRAGAVDAQSDTMHAFLYLLAAWLATGGITRGNFWRLAGAGVASGLAFWIRPEGLEIAVVASLFVVWQAFRAPWPWGKSAAALLATAGIALLIAAPYMLLAGKITSKQLWYFKYQPGPTYIERVAEAKGAEEQVAEAPQAAQAPVAVTEPAVAAAPNAPPVEATRAAPAPPLAPTAPVAAQTAAAPPAHDAEPSLSLIITFVGLALAAFCNSIAQGLKFVFIPYYLLGDIGLYWRSPPRIQVAFLAMLGGFHILLLMGVFFMSGYIAHRHTLPLVGLAMPFAAYGIWFASEVVGSRVRVRPQTLAVGTLVVCCLIVLPFTLRDLNREFVPVIEATGWVEAQLAPGSGIICNSPYVEFYSRRPVAVLEPLSPSLSEALIKAPDARYDFVVMHVNAHDYRPEWLDQLAPYYRQVHEIIDPRKYRQPKKVLVFQVKDVPIRNAALPPRP